MTTLRVVVFAADDGQLLLGDDFFPWIALAFGAAMVVGNVLALVRPPKPTVATPPDPPGHRTNAPRFAGWSP